MRIIHVNYTQLEDAQKAFPNRAIRGDLRSLMCAIDDDYVPAMDVVFMFAGFFNFTTEENA